MALEPVALTRERWSKYIRPALETMCFDKQKYPEIKFLPEDVYADLISGKSALVMDSEDETAGFLVVQLDACPYTQEKFLHVWVAFVPKEKRGNGALATYLPQVKNLARKWEAKSITMISSQYNLFDKVDWLVKEHAEYRVRL